MFSVDVHFKYTPDVLTIAGLRLTSICAMSTNPNLLDGTVRFPGLQTSGQGKVKREAR